jgi:hypothetical protein
MNTDKDAVLNTDENVDSDSSDQEFFLILSENCLDVEIDIQSNHNCLNYGISQKIKILMFLIHYQS